MLILAQSFPFSEKVSLVGVSVGLGSFYLRYVDCEHKSHRFKKMHFLTVSACLRSYTWLMHSSSNLFMEFVQLTIDGTDLVWSWKTTWWYNLHTAGSDTFFIQIYMDAPPGVPGVSKNSQKYAANKSVEFLAFWLTKH